MISSNDGNTARINANRFYKIVNFLPQDQN